MRGKVIIALVPLLAILSLPALAEEDLRAMLKQMSAQIAGLKRQAEQSNARIGDLERQLARAQAEQPQGSVTNVPAGMASNGKPLPPGPAVDPAKTAGPAKKETQPAITVGDVKGTFKIPGTDTSLGFGGFAKLDVLYNSVSAGSNKLGNQYLVASQIPVGPQRTGENSQIIFNPKESRFWLKSFTPSAWGDINTFVELDFYGSTDTYTYTPRLRHAYGSIGNFLAGQTWTTFLNVAVIPDTLDLGGPVGNVLYLRQPQVRWTQPFSIAGTPLELQVAAESPRSRLWEAPQNEVPADGYGFVYPDDDRYPDMIARLNFNPDWGTLSLAGMARQIRNANPKTGRQQEAWGGAVSLAGKVQAFDLDNVRFTFNYGDVFGRYASINTFEDATLDASGNLHLVNAYSAMVAYQHWWDTAWRTTLAYGFEQADQPAFVSGTMTRQAQSVHVNLLWSPVLQTTFGLEYIYATRELNNGERGDLNRVQFSTRFNF